MKKIYKEYLAFIIMKIPQNEINTMNIKELHRKYGYDFTYNTFRNYLRAFRG